MNRICDLTEKGNHLTIAYLVKLSTEQFVRNKVIHNKTVQLFPDMQQMICLMGTVTYNTIIAG